MSAPPISATKPPATTRTIRVLLALLACSAAVPGTWAVLAPRSFYTTFPGAGHWIELSGPYSEHLARDTGAFYLAFALMFAWAAYRPDPILVIPLCAGWATFSVLHVAWHTGHLEPFALGNAIAQTAGLLAVLALAAGPVLLTRRTPVARIGREPTDPTTTPQTHKRPTPTTPDTPGVRVYPLRLGATTVPFGQFYGGLAGWRGWAALFRYATDKRHFIRVPIHAYLIEHPQDGLILVDTGISWRQTHEHGEYYTGIQHYLFNADEYRLDRSEELPAALARLGHRPEDIRRVVITHLHEDHIGGLSYLPDAEILMSRDEWDNRGWKLFGFVPMVYQGSLPPTGSVTPIDFTSGPFENFETSHRLTSDGAVILLPTPGHSPGHLSVLIQLDGYQLLITGDCLYTLRHLANDDIQAFGAAQMIPDQNAAIARIAELKRRLPDLILVPGHDHTPYQFDHLVPGLAKGHLTAADRAAIHDFETTVFTPQGRLRPEAMPHYLPGPPPDHVGQVTPVPEPVRTT